MHDHAGNATPDPASALVTTAVRFSSAASLVLAPFVHRIMRKIHLEDE